MKRMLPALLALITLLGAAMPALAAPTQEDAMADARIYAVGESVSYLIYDGDPKGLTPTYYTGMSVAGKPLEYPAYCIDPAKPGPIQVGAYSVDARNPIDNPTIWGIVANGYPYKTIGDLGVHTREQAFYATKMALWTYLNNWDVGAWTAANGEQEVTLAALKKIYAAGMAVTSIAQPMLTVASDKPKAGLDALNPNYASQAYTVTANMEIRSYEVFLDGDIPDGTKIADMNNNLKTVFSAGEKFKVLIPANQIQNATGSFEVTAKGQLKTNAVIYGMSYDTALQDFAVTRDPFNFQNAAANVLYSPQNTFLKIVKLAAGTSSPLAGAMFKVTDSEGGVVGTFTTDSGGSVTVPLTKAGAYHVEEITPPSGFLLDVNSHKDIAVTWEQTTTVTFTNEKRPGLDIRKIDADTGAGVENAVIRITREGEKGFTDVTTGVDGRANLSGLEPGTYSVTEISAPEFYALDPTPQTVILEAGRTATVTLKNSKKPGIVIWKYDEDSALPLAGAEFSIAKKGGSIVFEGVTGAAGMILVENLDPNQWYTVTELAAPKGYLKTAESKDVYLEPGKTVEIKFDNRLRPALRVIKLDAETRLPLAGAVFHVRKAEGGTVSEYVTDTNGTFTIGDLDEAVYTVTEITPPTGYLLDPDAHRDILLEWGRTKELVFADEPKPGLLIRKIDADTNAPLPGAAFRIASEDGFITRDVQTDASGAVHIPGLMPGVYTITELTPPAGYLPDAPAQTILLEAGQQTAAIFANHKKPSLIIRKYDEGTGLPLPGAEFSVAKKGGAIVWEGMVDEGGIIRLDDLDPGWYTVTEIAAPIGYLKAAPKDVYLEGSKEVTLKFDNRLRPALRVIKLDANTGKPLPGAVFSVRKTEGGTVSEYITDTNGTFTVGDLDEAVYTVTEITPPTGYLPDPDARREILLEWGKTKELVFADYPYGSLLISKTDALTGTPLAGAKFKVTDSAGTVVGNTNGEFITDSRGEILIPNVKPGSYVVTETQAPVNYAINTTPKTVQVGTDGKTYKAAFDNYPYGTLVIRKSDSATKEPLAGAAFKVTATDGSTVGTSNGIFTTDETGTITIPNLPKAGYVVTEIKAPDGYVLESQSQTVAVEYGKTHTVDIYNKRMSGVQIIKIDATTKEPLKGAKFTVYKKSGAVMGNYETNGDGVIILDNLAPGWYKAVETKAPDGWLLDDTPQDFEVTANQFIKLVFENRRLSSLQIRKESETDGTPLAGAVFDVRKQDGEYVGEYTTGADGAASIPNAAPGWYVVSVRP